MAQSSHVVALPAPLTGARRVALGIEEVLDLVHQREKVAFEKGRDAGERALAHQLVQLRTDIGTVRNGILTQLQQTAPQTALACEDLLVELCAEIATRLVGSLPVSRELVAGAVSDALSRVRDTSEVTVAVHPEDLRLLESTCSNGDTTQPLPPRTKLEADPTIGRGGCVVRTAFGILDGRREVRAAALKEALKP